MKTIIEHFVGVTTERKQVKIIKTTKPMNGYPGKYEIPSFELSTGEHLNPLNKELTKFRKEDSEVIVVIYDQPKEIM